MSTQREIKFRAWDTNSGKMADIDMRAYLEPHGLNETIEQHTKDGLVLMQYTGLKDKNGKEIYEGDILRIGEDDEDDRAEIVKVEWLERYPRNGAEMCAFMLVGAWDKEFAHFYDYAFCGLEVIGNIYENPELLEKK